MSRAYLHKIEAAADEGATASEDALARPRPNLVVERTLDELLERCADGHPDGIEALLRWQHGRLAVTLERMLGDPDLKQHALHELVADLPDYPTAGCIGAEAAEDWLFARLRWHARTLQRSVPPAPRPEAVSPAPPSPLPSREPAYVGLAPAEPVQAEDLEPPAIYPRLRRPNARAHVAPLQTLAVMEPAAPPRWRRAALLLVLWLAAGAAGFAALALILPGRPAAPPQVANAVAPLPEPSTTSAARLAPEPEPVAAAPPPEPVAPTVAPRPDARALLGAPIAAPEPATVALPQQLTADDVPMSVTSPAPRVVIHYGVASASGAALARSIAASLAGHGFGEPELRAVPHNVGTTSIRYFRAADRAAAERLVATARPLLTEAGRAAPSTPIDFTDYQPLPRPGTLEIWVPGD